MLCIFASPIASSGVRRQPTPGRFRGVGAPELAKRLGTTQSAVARLEAGNVSPTLPTLDKVAEALGVELVVCFMDLDNRIAG